MNEKLIIKEVQHKNQLVEVDKIQKLLKFNNDKLTLIFEGGKVDDDYRKTLQKELPQYHVFNVRWKPEIWIYPSIATMEILDKAEEIYRAARTFREDGIKLIKMLGEAYQINPLDRKSLMDLKIKTKDNKQRGSVNEVWDFWFHGAECQFENKVTGQIIELVIIYGDEFGALDSYCFLNYLKTTAGFKELADFFLDDPKAVTKALNILEDLGRLYRIDHTSQRGIIAK